MKKGRKILLGAMLATTTALAIAGLAGCGHTHTYSEKWTSDETNHWHAATCTDGDDCKTAIDGKAAHADTDKDGKCDVCEYVMHEHSYATTWSSDASGHWYAANCTYGDSCTTAKKDSAAHIDANGDGICDTCNYLTKATMTGAIAAAGLNGSLSVDLVKKEAVAYMEMSVDVGVVMTFPLLVETKPANADPTLYGNCLELGKGTITDEGNGNFKANFTYDMTVTDEESGESTTYEDIPLVIPFTVNNGEYAATISVGEGAQAINLPVAAHKTHVDANNDGVCDTCAQPITAELKGNLYNMIVGSLKIDLAKGEAVAHLEMSTDVGGGFIMTFPLLVETKPENPDPMLYGNCLEIGKGTVELVSYGHYKANFTYDMTVTDEESGSSTTYEDIPLSFDFYYADGVYTGAIIVGEGDQAINLPVTSAVVEEAPAE